MYAKMGVIFCSMDEALKKHATLLKKYFGKLVPNSDNKYASLNSAV
jgi:Fe-S cluster assembly protein SufB